MELKRLLELAGAPISEAKKDDKSDDKCEKCDCDPCKCEDEDKDDDDKSEDKDDDKSEDKDDDKSEDKDDDKSEDKDDDDDKEEVKEHYDFGSKERMRFLAGLDSK